jgi:hypothetical protein
LLFVTLLIVTSKDKKIQELEQATDSMVQGSLSELTRQCGDPACACAHDPARRHGPHLYFNYKAEGKAHSVYIPAEQSETVKSAHSAWRQFQEIGAQIATQNRDRMLQTLELEKQRARTQRARARSKSSSD